MPDTEVHECVNTWVKIDDHDNQFICRACSFVGTLRQAIEHIVANQFGLLKRS